MKSFFAKLFTKSGGGDAESSNYLSNLERLQKQHSFIEVKILRLARSYQSMILKIDHEEQTLLIDDLFPPDNTTDVLTGDTFEITSQSKKDPLHFFSRLLAKETLNGSPMYRIELPKEMALNQGRSAYRVYVGNEQDLHIQLPNLDGRSIAATIINLSPEGIKIDFDTDVSEYVYTDNILEDCCVNLPIDANIYCDITIKNAYLMRTPTHHVLAGGTLSIANPAERNKLEQYLIAVQRRQRRTELRMK